MAHVLVVDDDDQLRTFAKNILPLDGHTIDEVANITEAKQKLTDSLQSGGKPYNVILTDINMPDGTGIDLANWVQQENYPAKVVLQSGQPGQVQNNTTYNSLVAGGVITDLLAKPYTPTNLLQTIKAAAALQQLPPGLPPTPNVDSPDVTFPPPPGWVKGKGPKEG